jgi:ribosome-associated heat shock protein Hsp15
MDPGVRIDKWLFAVRIFKTRTLATDECNKGRITIGGISVKPSRIVKEGDVIDVRKPPLTYKYKVLKLAEKRMSAKLVPEFSEDITPKEQFEILEMQRLSILSGREKGTGRPTKKDRRSIDDFFNC